MQSLQAWQAKNTAAEAVPSSSDMVCQACSYSNVTLQCYLKTGAQLFSNQNGSLLTDTFRVSALQGTAVKRPFSK